MKTSATNRRIHQLLTGIAEGRLNPRPDFQRRMVWTNDDKLKFLQTVLRGLPFPEIYVCAGSLDADTGAATEYLFDGQQRLTTLHQYFKALPGLRLGTVIPPYAGLPKEEKEQFLEYEVVVRDLGKLEIDTVREIFQLINSANYALNSIEIHNARYAGKFKTFCEEVANREEFRTWKTFRTNDIRRMQDLRYCLVLVATMLSTYFNRDDDIAEYLEKYNDAFPPGPDMRARLDDCFRFVTSMDLPAKARTFQKTDLFSLLVELDRALRRKVALEPRQAAQRLLSFYQQVDRADASTAPESDLAQRYYWSTVRAAIDRSNRFTRGEILQHVLDPSYTPQLKFAALVSMEAAGQGTLTLEEGDYDLEPSGKKPPA